jgi:pimeloyl-ACP methyl ester carboxylesterase
MSSHPRHATFSGTEGNKLEGDVYGYGRRTALLLHGGGQTRHAWRATARKLGERDFTAIPVDQRGHGDSAWIGSGAYALADYAMDAVSLGSQIEQRFGAKPVAIGASLGGLASLYALGEAVCFSALVLVDIVPRTEARGVAHVQNFMRAKVDEGFRWYWHWDPRFWEGPRSVDADGDTLLPRLEEIARGLTVPTLLVRGGSSDIVSPESAKAFCDLVPHAKLVDVSGAGHMVAGDMNDIFASTILEFLD